MDLPSAHRVGRIPAMVTAIRGCAINPLGDPRLRLPLDRGIIDRCPSHGP